MLPEKRKKLTITIIAIIFIIIGVYSLGKLSNYIKSKNTKEEQRNDEYTDLFDYIGISKDKDGIYKLYGISDSEETYLDVKTFYEVKDVTVINKRLVLYSDATNELRYTKEKEEFYFYEIDSYYNKSDSVNLASDYLIINDNQVKYKKYGTEEFTNLNKITDYLVNGNKLYILKSDSIYEYDLNTLEEKMVVVYKAKELVKLLAVSNEYIYYLKDNVLNVTGLKSNFNKELTDMEFISLSSDGFITKKDNILTNYSLTKEDYTYDFSNYNNIDSIIYLDNDLFYISYDKNYVILDMKKNRAWKSLENDYIYLRRINYEN